MPREETSVEGVVTAVYPKLFAFDMKVSGRNCFVPRTATIHMVLSCKERKIGLPETGMSVTAKSCYFNLFSKVVVAMIITPESQIQADGFSGATPSLDFIQIVNDLKLTPEDLLRVASHFDSIKKNFKSPHAGSEDFILATLKALQGCKFQLLFVRNLRFIDYGTSSSCRMTYKQFPYWTFGCHYSLKNKFLIGFFFLPNYRTGMWYFTDTKRRLPVIFINQKENEIDFLNQYVVIKDYNVITEIYNCPKFRSLEYLLVDLSKVIKLGISVNMKVFANLSEIDASYKKVACTIVSKSLPTAVSKIDVIHWMEVEMENNTYGFLRLPTAFKGVFPFLKCGHTHHILYKKPPKKVYDAAVQNMSKIGNPEKTVFLSELVGDTFFTPAISNRPLALCDVSEAAKKLSQNGLVSFQGKISLKTFTTPIQSRTKVATNSLDFGTPGFKTPRLRFEMGHRGFDVYLNNWENLTLPYGLIPDMRVIVRNVLPQKGKYYKATSLTSFEVLAYEPTIKFETADLLDMNRSYPFYFSLCQSIPTCTVIYCRILRFEFLSIHIVLAPDGTMTGEIKMLAYDNFGESKIIAKESAASTLFRLILRFQKPAFEVFRKGYSCLKEFTYRKNGPPMKVLGIAEFIYTVLYQYIKSIENKPFVLDLVCRKMDVQNDGVPVFFLIEGLDVKNLSLS